MEKLRKQRGYTQEYMSNIISTDVSNYSRKENDEVRIFDDEWEKLAKALDVPVEEIKEERKTAIVHNNHDNTTFNDNAGSYFNHFHSIPDSIVENLQSYIKILEEQIETLKEENKILKSK
ncbi:Helix-turn-helix domain [Chryseobacterium nakagawai]|uniref:XRE family transcriptional regulator n=1 Tax=Chryseobacterium nakagawai TaxID=1241982 RepID=A0AAD0YQQ4_CHRNA|nr:helix-turn-helix transcriptional regulator [Chryseobacterium nakagawai]AZA93250.1 XRE family transcriptional regulator [Chryseobacterium nakagawai]VEH19910.1 Helix-turn-helix domain [Chryseobacterium nakagawai]